MSSNVSSSILQAVNFLTRPLSLVQDAYTICALQSRLRSNFHTAFAGAPNKRLVMAFTTEMPPRPVWEACIATGVRWYQWIQFFGQQEFDLIIEETSVVARYDTSETGFPAQAVTIWSAPQLTAAKRSLLAKFAMPNVAPVPIRKLERHTATQSVHGMTPSQPRITLPAAPLNPRSQRTLAQQLIDSDDDSGAEELFAMISKTSIICPTPKKAHFPLNLSVALSPLSSPEPSETSRPSSRTSTLSSCFSDEGSLSSASTTPSTSVSLESIDPEAHPESDVYVDNSKKDKTKYLYRGGLSSTLTGGVMLGRPSKTTPQAPTQTPSTSSHPIKASVQQQEKYRGPFGGRRGATQPNSASWKRAPAATAVGTANFRRF